jgi:hypothetical protein
MARQQPIVTYIPRRPFESVDVNDALKAAPKKPTPDELAAFSQMLQLLEGTQARPGVMTTVPDELTANFQTFLTEVAARPEAFPASVTGPLDVNPGANNTLEVKFDEKDLIGWAGSFFTWWRKLKKFPWTPPGAPERIGNDFRVAVLADWGTGLYGAPECAKAIAKDGKYQLVLHLGDVYYSGTEGELAERFTALWPAVPGAMNRALNGNHEMYTGGNAYWKALSGTPFNQASSYFALENDNWLLACLDTAYAEHDLHGEQASWLKALADAAPQKKLVLFSHHQPYSLLDKQGPALIAKLGALLEGRIFAWYWGHEHHCIIYKQHPLWGLHGRCIGHSGFPYFREKKVLGEQPPATPGWKNLNGKNLVPGARVLDGKNEYVDEDGDQYGPNGYVTLEFSGTRLVEAYHLPDGTVVLKQIVE